MGNTQTMTGNLTFEDAWAGLLAADRNLKEAAMKVQETNRKIGKLVDELEKELDTASRKVDDAFVLALERECRVRGFAVERYAENAFFGNRVFLERYVEIDVFLENREKAVAVAVKARVSPVNSGDVREHIGRMEKLRRCFAANRDRRKLYGAVAAASFPAEVRDFALERGLYVIEYQAERMVVREPEGGVKAW